MDVRVSLHPHWRQQGFGWADLRQSEDEQNRCSHHVGGSFIFQVADTLAEQRLCSKIDVLFYDNKWIHYQGAARGRKQSIDKRRRNLLVLFSGYDAVVIESNEILLRNWATASSRRLANL